MRYIIPMLLVLFLTGCEEQAIQENIKTQPGIQLTLDKELYHSNEDMNITVDIYSDREYNTTVKVYGIYASRNRLELSKELNIQKGKNTIAFNYKTPSCNTCSGIRAGTYTITAETEGINTTKEIEIQQ